MSPEQTRRGGEIGPPTDVWAIGLIAFFLLARRSYWLCADEEGRTMEMLLREIVLDPMPPASARAEALGRQGLIPAGFDAWFARAVDRKPALRFDDAGDALAELDRVLRQRPSAYADTVDASQQAMARTWPGTVTVTAGARRVHAAR
jgi:eukaryotic-like serine/threonine-protein kinase